MKNISLKLRVVFIPFLYIALGFATGYTVLHWLFLIRHPVIDLPDEVVDLAIPTVLVWVPLLIWWLPRLRLLKFDTFRIRRLIGYLLIASFSIALPTSFLQGYLRTASGHLTRLEYISHISSLPLTRYYNVQHCFIDTAGSVKHHFRSVSGKRQTNLELYAVFIIPVYDSIENSVSKRSRENLTIHAINDTVHLTTSTASAAIKAGNTAAIASAHITPRTWLCVKYHKRISNQLSIDEEKQQTQQFYAASDSLFAHQPWDQFTYLDRISNNNNRSMYASLFPPAVMEVPDPPILLEPRFTPFADRNGDRLFWAVISFLIAASTWVIILLMAGIDEVKAKYIYDKREGAFYSPMR